MNTIILNKICPSSQYIPVTPYAPDLKLLRDSEAPVSYRLNETGNIFYSSTETNLNDDARDLFDSVTVLFSAMTTAMGQKGKDLFDYDSWTKIIRGSGFFAEIQKFTKTLEIKSGSLSIDTQVIQQLIPGITTGNSLEIAKGVLASINGTFSAEDRKETDKIGHVLFYCEELFGAPNVTVRLFFASKDTHKNITSSPCHKSAISSFEQVQEANTFLFVDAARIAKYAKMFDEQPEEYTSLINKLASLITS